MLSPLDNLGRIFTPSPVNRHHSLNQGRVGWWLGIPGITGGRQLFDLMGLNHGILTNMGTGSGWHGAGNPTGSRPLLFDGVDDKLVVADSAAWNSTNWTVGCSFMVLGSHGANSSYNGLVSRSPTTNSAGKFFVYQKASDLKIHVDIPFVVADAAVGASVVSSNIWYRLLVTKLGTSYAIYINSKLDSTTTTTNSPTNSGPFQIGTITNDSGELNFNGAIDDTAFWSRPLSAREVQQDYILSRQGYPDVLNRLSTRVYSIPSGGTVATRLLSLRRKMMVAA